MPSVDDIGWRAFVDFVLKRRIGLDNIHNDVRDVVFAALGPIHLH